MNMLTPFGSIGPRLFGLLLVGAMVCPAPAQEYIAPPAGSPVNGPPTMELPSVPSTAGPALGSGTRSYGAQGEIPSMELPSYPGEPEMIEQPGQQFSPQPMRSGDLQPGLQPYEQADDFQVLDCQPALLESTGTWLRRGFWYSEVDVMLMDRIWRRDNFLLAFQANAGGNENQLVVNGGYIGAEAAPRLNLGRFLFRDHKNRDHAMEFVAYGGGQWEQSGRLDATEGNTLNSGFYSILVSENFNGQVATRIPLDQGNISFDGATSTQYEYDSRFNDFELNYRVSSRMLRDRMELEPSGAWVRRAQPSLTGSVLAGLRYFNLSEEFDWQAFGIDEDNNPATDPQTGNYRVRTDNDLVGTQLGFTASYETARWSLGLKTKSGMFLNHTDVNSAFEVTGGVTSGDNDLTIDNLSFIIESGLLAKWHLSSNFSLRAGFEVLYVSSVAHASEQLNFIPVQTADAAIVNGDSTFMGGLIGFEGYW